MLKNVLILMYVELIKRVDLSCLKLNVARGALSDVLRRQPIWLIRRDDRCVIFFFNAYHFNLFYLINYTK
jgi:hypothetical protein